MYNKNRNTYNANGIRTSKTVDGVLHTYQLDGTKILKETWGDCTLIPLYDNEDSVCGIIYDDAAYYFHKNLQGDVIGIKNAYGVLVARYTYDAWGKVIAVTDEDGFDVSDNAAHVANANPFRYRGYYYDAEIGMYYLQSRYYNPVVGRFINGDDVECFEYMDSILDLNLFTYTVNSPVSLIDACGEGWLKDKLKKAIKKVKDAADTVVGWAKKTVINIGTGIKNICSSIGDFFKNTVWRKWLVEGFWKTFCQKGVWETFCKKWVLETFCKKWVWETFCKDWTWETFCKKWTWETFCKKWVWETFCKKWVWETFCKKWVWETFWKDWIVDKAWNWINGNKWYQILSKSVLMGLIGLGIGALFAPVSVPTVIAAAIVLVITFVWEILSQGWNT